MSRHRGDLVVGGGALGRVLAHHVQAERCVAQTTRDIDRGAARARRVEELREGLERPLGAEPGEERVDDMPSTFSSVRRSVAVPARVGATPKPQLPITTEVTPCQGEMVSMRIPEDLGVVVRVDVDEARRHDHAVGIDRARALPRHAERGDCRP